MGEEQAKAVTEHYQKTFELTHEMWRERNKLFVYLVLTTGGGLLFLLRVPEFDRLLVETIASILNISDPARIAELYSDFPFDVLLSAVLVIVFYLMQKLYATNLSVSRYYLYLGTMEDEIRKLLALTGDSVAFTREGKFYWDGRTIAQNISKWLYVVVIAITILPFSVLKVISDFKTGNPLLIAVDIIVSLMTVVYMVEYTRSALHLDVRSLVKSNTGGGAKPKGGK